MKKRYTAALAAEFLGSMFLVTAAVASILLFTAVLEAEIGLAVFANAVMVAFVLCALIEIFSPVSGAHFNPVVTMIMLFERKIRAGKAVMYVTAQIAGGLAGTALGHLMFLDEIGSLFTVSDIARNDYVYIGEIVGTFVLVLALLMLVKAGSKKISFVVAFLVGGQVMATSSTMFANPQVTIARMFTNSPAGIRPTDGLIFIVMQVSGALMAYAVYKLIFAKITYETEEK